VASEAQHAETQQPKEHQCEPGQLLYSVPQAARVLGLSPRLVWAFVASNRLKTRRIGTRVLVHRRELEKFALRDHETKLAHVKEERSDE
jgi:excisionase family DNA binding protein